MNEPEEIEGVKGNTIPRRLSVDYISFSAHVDGPQNIEFIEQVKAQHIVSLYVYVLIVQSKYTYDYLKLRYLYTAMLLQ